MSNLVLENVFALLTSSAKISTPAESFSISFSAVNCMYALVIIEPEGISIF